MTERPYNAANRKDVREAEKRQLLSLVIRGEIITGLMSVPNGRQWMHELLAAAHFFSDPFSPDPYIHAANSGQRGLGLQLFADIMAFCPKSFTLMIEEHHVRSSATERSRSPNTGGGVDRPDDNTSGTESAPGTDHDPYAGTEGPSGAQTH